MPNYLALQLKKKGSRDGRGWCVDRGSHFAFNLLEKESVVKTRFQSIYNSQCPYMHDPTG